MKNKLRNTVPYLALFSVSMLIFAFVSLFFSKTMFYIEMSVAVVSIATALIIYIRFEHVIHVAMRHTALTTRNVDKRYLERFSFPVAATDKESGIIWYNSAFLTDICKGSDVHGYSVTKLLSGKDVEEFCGASGGNTSVADRLYTVYANPVETGYLLYFFDDTYLKETEREYMETRLSVAMVSLDNNEAYDDDDEDDAIRVNIQVESLLQRFAGDFNALYRKMSQGRYMLIFEERELQKIIEKKFDILEKIHEIKSGDISATISVGIGRGEDNLRKSQASAKKALDMALGRGGDQVAILSGGDYEFFGGKSAGVEKQSKVRARVITKSVINAVEESDKVIIMGHRFSDLDCMGSAIGLYGAITTSLKKKVYIAVNYQDSMAKSLIDAYKVNCGEDVFVSPEKLMDEVTPETLLIIVDTQSKNRLESTALFEKCGRIIVIDHHRMSVDYIEDTLVFYHEPSASSAAEMCVEIVENFPDDVLRKPEAEALLSGIILDTKNFVINSGARTFEAAAYLKKHGADTVSVRQLFADSIEIYRNKYKLVSTARIYKKCAIVIADEDMAEIRLIASKAADELLGLKGVNASFVVYRTDSNTVNISARSYGKRNVQLIMEKLGGGGHHSMAAAQIKDTGFESVVRMLVEAIDSE
ncbi:MAG: DHH family phosphoesterase [Ruminococcus sp.]|nr:DHH family phosphoesterase [Ruminococcus sp.]